VVTWWVRPWEEGEHGAGFGAGTGLAENGGSQGDQGVHADDEGVGELEGDGAGFAAGMRLASSPAVQCGPRTSGA